MTYFVEDLSIMAILAGLNITNADCLQSKMLKSNFSTYDCPYIRPGSTLTFELHNLTNKWAIRVSY